MANEVTLIADGIQSLTAGLGTDRDKVTSLEYVAVEYDDSQLEAVYRTSWLARKIVTIPALDMFREWRAWQAENDLVELLDKEEARLRLRQKLVRAKTLARLYGEAFLYFDLGEDASKPVVPERVKLGGIRFVTVMSHRQMVAGDVDQDPLSPTFGEPLYYRVAGGMRGDVVIHPSRLLRFVGAERPDEFALYGSVRRSDSVLISLLASVSHFDSTEANVASLVFEAKIDVISVKGLMAIAGNPYEEQKLLARYRLAATAKGNNGMLLLDGDSEEYSQKTLSFTALTDIMDRQAQNASGGADIPMTRLFGQSPGGMNSTGDSDIRNYYDRIGAEQELEVRPILEPFDECLIRSALGSRPPEVHYKWNSLWQMSDKERSELGTAGATMIKSIKETGLIPDEVLAKVVVNLATQDGTLPGLEGEYTTFFEEGGEWDLEQEEPPEELPPGGQPPVGKKAAELADEQARAPKGTPNGGQWVKGAVGGGAVANALNSVASGKYNAGAILALTHKDPKALTHYEKKVVAKYKKALANEKVFEADQKAMAAKAEAKPLPQLAAAKKATADLKPSKAQLAGKAANDVDEALSGNMKPSEAMASVKKAQYEGAISNGEFKEHQSKLVAKAEMDAQVAASTYAYGHPDLDAVNQKKYEEAKGEAKLMQHGGKTFVSPEADTKAAKADKTAAMFSKPDTPPAKMTGEEAIVAYGQGKITHSEMKAAQTPEVDAEFETFEPSKAGSASTDAALNKVATAQYPAEKVKGLLSKDPKTLTHYEKKKLAAYKKALQEEGGTAKSPATKKVDPNSTEAQAVFAQIGASKGMKADTVQKLATGEWQPQAGKAYQSDIQAQAKTYLETGQKPAKVVINNSNGAYGPSLAKSLTDTPPPISNPNVGQQELAGLHPLAPHEKSAAMKYTGSTYHDINSALRKGSTHDLVPAIDGAMAKSYAKEPMVVVRGISSTGMQHWLSKNGGAISVGATIQDKGYASTTRKAQTASNFAGGGSGFGLKINVPKGAKILPLKSISHFANEDEFLLPRGSSFKITGFDQNTKVISVDLVSA